MEQYLSPAWMEELKREIAALPAARTRGATASLNLRHKNAPGGGDKHLYLAFRNGTLVGAQAGAGEGPGAEFVIEGAYDTFAQVLSGRLEAGSALSGGKLRLRGNMLRAMGLIPLIETIIAAARGIPTTF